jgi:hypothetical protein
VVIAVSQGKQKGRLAAALSNLFAALFVQATACAFRSANRP